MPAILASLDGGGRRAERARRGVGLRDGQRRRLTGHVLSMRDQGLAAVGPDGRRGYTITEVDDNLDAQGRCAASSAPSRCRSSSTTRTSRSPRRSSPSTPSGNPQLLGTYQAPFTDHRPRRRRHEGAAARSSSTATASSAPARRSSATRPARTSRTSRTSRATSSSPPTGLACPSHENPLSTPAPTSALAYALTDFNDMPWITDRLQQALVNTMVLERTMVGRIVERSGDDRQRTGRRRRPSPIPTRVTYYGISLGGIMGLSFMGYDPDVDAGRPRLRRRASGRRSSSARSTGRTRAACSSRGVSRLARRAAPARSWRRCSSTSAIRRPSRRYVLDGAPARRAAEADPDADGPGRRAGAEHRHAR